MSDIATKLTTIAENIPKVYAAGKDYMWDIIQQKGERTNYASAFVYWNVDYVRPKYKVVPTHQFSSNQTFNSSKIKKVEAEYFDFSQKAFYNGSNAGVYYMFNACTLLEEIEDIKMPLVPNYSYAFAYCYKLHTIGFPLKCDETTTWSNTFTNCSALQNVTIDGKIGQKSFNVSTCKKLTKASLLSILKALSLDITATTTITFSTVHQITLETDEDCKPYYEAAKAAGWSFVFA